MSIATNNAELVEKARTGDDVAWETLYRNVYPRLRAYALRRCDGADSEDLVNEAMARAVGAIGRFRWEQTDFDAWLFGILRRVCLEHHRRRHRFFRVVRFETRSALSSPDEDVERREDHAEVRRAFAMLSPQEQELLELRIVSGLSAEAVARLLGKRAGAVRTAQSRALAQLRAHMRSLT